MDRTVENTGCRLAGPTTADPVHGVLNRARSEFWNAPADYADWGKRALAALG